MITSNLFRNMKSAVVFLGPLAMISGCGNEAETFLKSPRQVEAQRKVESAWRGTGLDFAMLEKRVNTQTCQQTPQRLQLAVSQGTK